MLNIRKILYLAVAAGCCGFLTLGCVREEVSAPVGQRSVSVRLNVGTRAVDAVDGTPTREESALHSLRVYAFVNGKPAGHYYRSGETTARTSFLMDLTMASETSAEVDFYIVANEKAMENPGAEAQLTETTTETQLNDYTFTRLNTTYGLPMFCRESRMIDFSQTAADNPQAGSGHEGHTLLEEKFEFWLQRPFGKLGVFAAKPAEETGTLKVTGLTMLESGTRFLNYLMPQEEKTLRAVSGSTGDLDLSVVGDEITAVLAADISDAGRQDPGNYTALLGEPFYPFENPWGNGGDWNTVGDENGNVLRIDYAFDEGQTRTGYVYMPPIERNRYYTVCCLMHNSGKITVAYSVADWDDDTYELQFEYPTYDNPLQPVSANWPTVGAEKRYAQPEIYCDGDPDSEAGAFSFRFTISGPQQQEWQPTLLGATGDFGLTVYSPDGTKAEPPYLASAEGSYRIVVKALNPQNIGKTARLAIAYTPKWELTGSSLLLINGQSDATRWEGSDLPEVIEIRQIDIPIP